MIYSSPKITLLIFTSRLFQARQFFTSSPSSLQLRLPNVQPKTGHIRRFLRGKETSPATPWGLKSFPPQVPGATGRGKFWKEGFAKEKWGGFEDFVDILDRWKICSQFCWWTIPLWQFDNMTCVCGLLVLAWKEYRTHAQGQFPQFRERPWVCFIAVSFISTLPVRWFRTSQDGGFVLLSHSCPCLRWWYVSESILADSMCKVCTYGYKDYKGTCNGQTGAK